MRRLLLLSFLLLLALPAAASAQADRTWVSRNGGGSTLSSLTNGFIVNMSLNNTDTVRRVVLHNL